MSNLLFDPIKTQARVTDSVIVGFSGGKDSIVTLDLCFKYFKRVVPFYMYFVPDLEFQERTMRWYENKYNTEIIRIPHFENSRMLRYGTYNMFESKDVGVVGINDIYEYLRQKTGIYWIAAGERCADSIVRNAMIKKSGSVDYQRGRFYPIAYWNKKEVHEYIKYKKLYLSPEQKKLDYSAGGLSGAELYIIREMYPKDYEKILKVFPLAGVAVKHYEEYEKV